MINIIIQGQGVVGQSTELFIKEYAKDIEIIFNDPPKGITAPDDAWAVADYVIVCVNTDLDETLPVPENSSANIDAAWQTSKGKSKSGGLNAKGVASYRRENPGSKLQMAVTTKPSKLKKGSKAAKRRKSFCARMSGVNGPMKKPNGKPTRKALALRKWNC